MARSDKRVMIIYTKLHKCMNRFGYSKSSTYGNGRHATKDVPELIHQARDILRQEGLLTLASTATSNDNDGDGDNNKDDEISIVMSDALGTHLVGMLSVVDDLVVQTLNNM